MRTLVKLGGRSLDDDLALDALARSIASSPGDFVLVHGGGHRISAAVSAAGLEVNFVDGLRVTTPEVMAITSRVLRDEINGELVARLCALGVPALGLSGTTDGMIQAAFRGDGRWGRVGSIVAVDPTPVLNALALGWVPVVAPVSTGPDGDPVNVNADEAALALAHAVGADRLLLVSDVPGVMEGGRVLEELDPARADELIASGVVHGGMAVKLREAMTAAARGLAVVIGDAAALREGTGTTIVVRAGAACAA